MDHLTKLIFFKMFIYFSKDQAQGVRIMLPSAQVAGVIAEYAQKFARMRWVSMKFVALRCLEKLQNLKEYFLKNLTSQKNFTYYIQNTLRYMWVKAVLTDPVMEAIVALRAFVANDFEFFSVLFQVSEPMIHLFHPALCTLFYELQRKFIKKASFQLISVRTFTLMVILQKMQIR